MRENIRPMFFVSLQRMDGKAILIQSLAYPGGSLAIRFGYLLGGFTRFHFRDDDGHGEVL